MNRLLLHGFLPNLSRTVKFNGGPWDGMYLHWAEHQCPEYIAIHAQKGVTAMSGEHKYKLCVTTNAQKKTQIYYNYVGPLIESKCNDTKNK